MAQQPHTTVQQSAAQSAKPEVKPETKHEEAKPEAAAPSVKIIQVAQQGSQLVALLSDGSLWAWAGVSWQSIPLPPPTAKTDH